MFIKWKKSLLMGKPSHYTHYAYLAKSVRIDGKPRQQVILYLGCIQEPYQTWGGYAGEFWFRVERVLRGAEVDSDTFSFVQREVAKRVPRPDALMEDIYRYMWSQEERKASNRIHAYDAWLRRSDIAASMSLQMKEEGEIL